MPSSDNEQQSFASASGVKPNWLEKFEPNNETFDERIERFKKDLTSKSDELHGKIPATADKVDELFMPGLTPYNKAFEKLRKEVSKVEKAQP